MTEQTLVTRIDRVTVHRNGALVVRVGSLTPAAWPARLVLPGLPLLFHSDTVRVRATDAGITAGPVEEAPELMLAAAPPSVDEDERARLKQVVAAATEAVSTWTTLESATEALLLPSKVELPREAPPELPALSTWTALHDLAATRRAHVARELAAARLRLREAQQALTQFEHRADPANAAPVRYARALRTRLFLDAGASPPESVEIEVEYFVAGARWAPTYALDIRAGRATLRLGALVAQATGEDWTGVKISACTADLRRSTALPRLSAWKIGRAAPALPGGWRPLPEDLESLYANFDGVPRPKTSRPARPAPKPAPAEPEPDLDEAVEALPPVVTVMNAPQPKARSLSAPPMASAPPGLMTGAAMPMPMRSAGPPRGAPFAAREEGAAFGGGAPAAPPAPAPPPPLHPGSLLDYAWLRLPTNDERGRRGRLWPVDAFSDLRALLDERAELDRYEALSRALDRQRADLARLGQLPLPPGCAPLASSAFPFRYPFGASADVPSDGRFHQIAVASGQGPVRQVCRVVPRSSSQAWRFALLENPLGTPLPAGPLRVSVDGAWRITSALPATGASGSLALNLGVEEGLRVARNATYTESEKGVLTSVTLGQHRVVTELRSRLDAAMDVELWERLPIAPEGSELSLTLDETSPTADTGRGPEGERVDGALRWALRLNPGEAATVRYAWTARVPARMEILGGNRREP